MADIRVDRRPLAPSWAWWTLLAVALILVVGLFTGWFGLVARQSALYNPDRPVASISYKGSVWIPRGNAVAYPEAQMVRVGTSPEGYELFANKQQGYTQGYAGGGGGEITPSTEPQAYGRVYVKTLDGRYQPFFLTHQTP